MIDLEEIYTLCSENPNKAMEELFTEMHRFVLNEKYLACEELLKTFDPERCPRIVGVGLLRACFPVRGQLPSWIPLRDRLKNDIGVPEHLLRGLL